MAAPDIMPERLFTALDIPDDIRAGVEAWKGRELTDPALRSVAAENLHLTLCFLGSVDAERVREAAAILRRIEPVPLSIRLQCSPVGRPPRRPGVLALEADAPAAIGLQAELAEAFAAAGLYKPEERPWWPHLTVARVRNEPGNRRPRRIGALPGDLPEELTQSFDAVRVSLYRSELRSDGAKYVSLANLNLPPSA